MKNQASAPSLEELLAYSGWVRALARSLVTDSSAADDVEQQVWLTAMERPPKHSRNLKAWLSSVVRSVAGQSRRTVERQERRDQKAGIAKEIGLGPADLAERMETFQALAALVSELEDPYGSAIYLRYFEDLSIAEVGRHQGVPTGTAQTRLHRGMEKLRGRMKARFGSDWKQRCVIFLAPLPAASAPVTFTGLLAMSKTKWMIAALALLAIPLFQILNSGPLVEESTVVESAIPEVVVLEPVEAVKEELPTPIRTQAEFPSVVYAEPSTASGAHNLTVLDEDGLSPTPFAEVLYFDRGNGDDDAFTKGMFRNCIDMESLLERFGTLYQADENGQLSLPPRTSYTWVAARSKGKYAQLYMFNDLSTHRYEEIELVLMPRVNISIRILDAEGSPAASVRAYYQTRFDYDEGGTTLAMVISDFEGKAVLRNLQSHFSEFGSGNTHVVVVNLPLENELSKQFSELDPPTEEMVFKLPATTSVNVRVAHADGKPVSDGKKVFLQIQTKDPLTGELISEANPGIASLSYVKDGVAVFPWVGVDIPIIAAASFPKAQGLQQVICRSNTYPNGSSEILITGEAATKKVYSTKVVRSDGSALSESSLSLSYRLIPAVNQTSADLNQNPQGLWTGTDDAGLVRFTVDPGELHVFLSHKSPGGGLMEWGTVYVPPSFERDSSAKDDEVILPETEIGKDLILHCVVQDSDGNPIVGASVGYSLHWVPPIADSYSRIRGGQFLHALTDEKGEMTIRGTLENPTGYLEWGMGERSGLSGELRIGPSESFTGVQQQAFPFKLGESDQVFRLRPRARVHGRIQLESSAHRSDLKVELHQTRADGEDNFPRWGEIDPITGKFEFDGLEAGTAILKCTSKMTGTVLAESQSFDVIPGENSTPTDWQPLDLRNVAFPHTLHVTDSNGQPIKQANIHLLHNSWISNSSALTPIQFLSTEAQVPVRASADGYRISPTTHLGETGTVLLEPAWHRTFKLPAGVNLTENGQWTLRAVSTERGKDLENWLPRVHALWNARQQSFDAYFPSTGRWQLTLKYGGSSLPGESHPQGFTVNVIAENGQTPLLGEITIRDSAMEDEVELWIDQQGVDQAIKAMEDLIEAIE